MLEQQGEAWELGDHPRRKISVSSEQGTGDQEDLSADHWLLTATLMTGIYDAILIVALALLMMTVYI